ncbi:MAG TPA: GAF domain-containing protein, partial [Candidatus Goldiibacteriota bacterium]|nr:GAF domain-containing protein [Candidatus Goldiibacteriota bacterium]
MKTLSSEDIFNIKTWDDLQTAIAQLLGMGIRVTDSEGNVTTFFDSFADICAAVKNTPLCGECDAFHGSIPVISEDPALCPARICHYTVESEFFYRKYYITVSALCGEHDDEFIENTAAKAGIKPADLAFLYATLPNYPQDKLKSWAQLIGNMFTKVMEPALQTNIMYMAEKEKEEEINKMKQLMKSNLLINSTRVLPSLLSIVSESAEKLVAAEKCLIYFVDYDSSELYYEWTHTERDKAAGKSRIKLGEGILGLSAKNGASITVNNPVSDPRVSKSENPLDMPVRNMICVPIKTSSTVIGVMQLLNRAEGAAFTASDQVFLENLAAQAAVAIENAVMYENMEGAAFKLNHQLQKSNINLSIEKKRVESIISSMEDAVVAIDRNSCIVLLNRAAERLFGVKSGQAIQAPAGTFIKDEKLLSLIDSAMSAGEIKKAEFTRPVFDEDHVFAAACTPVTDEDNTRAGAVAVFRDITKAKKLENLKSEFLNMVAHELRTPLTPIIAYIQLMLVRNPSPEKIRKYASLIFRETQRLSTLINDLLD